MISIPFFTKTKTYGSVDSLVFPSVGQQEKGVEIRLVHSYCKSFQFLFAPDMMIVPEDAELNHMCSFNFPFIVSPSPLMPRQLYATRGYSARRPSCCGSSLWCQGNATLPLPASVQQMFLPGRKMVAGGKRFWNISSLPPGNIPLNPYALFEPKFAIKIKLWSQADLIQPVGHELDL